MSIYSFNDNESRDYKIEQLEGDVEDLQGKVDKVDDMAFNHEDAFAIVIALFEKMELPPDAAEEFKLLRDKFYPPKKEEKDGK